MARWSIVFLICLLGTLPAASPGVAQETIAEAREELERVEEEKLALQARIDILAAEDVDVFRALQAAEELVARQVAQVEAAEQGLRAQIAIQRQNEAAIGWARLDIADVRQDAEAVIVEVYLQAGSERTATLLASDDLTHGLRRLALLEAVHGHAGTLLEDIRLAEDRYDAAVAEAAASVAEVERLQAALGDDLAVLVERRGNRPPSRPNWTSAGAPLSRSLPHGTRRPSNSRASSSRRNSRTGSKRGCGHRRRHGPRRPDSCGPQPGS